MASQDPPPPKESSAPGFTTAWVGHAADALMFAGALSLVTNWIPEVTVALWSVGAILGVLSAPKRAWGRFQTGVLLVWGFWLLSYALTSESWTTFFSFGFHRRDGQIFFSLLPLLALSVRQIRERDLRRTLLAFCLLQAMVTVAGWTILLLGRERDFVGRLFVASDLSPALYFSGLYRAHNAVGSVLALCSVACLAQAFRMPPGKPRWLWSGLAVLLLSGVVLSKSRGALLALVVVIALALVREARTRRVSRRTLLGVAAAAVIVLGSLSPFLYQRFGETAAQRTLVYRLGFWKRALQEWTWSPIVGEGLGRYNDLDRHWSGIKHVYFVVTEAKAVNLQNHAHNSYVQFLAEGGVAGLVLTVGFWGWVAWSFRKARGPVRLAAFLGVLLLLVISPTEHYMGGGVMLLALSCLVGAAWSLRES